MTLAKFIGTWRKMNDGLSFQLRTVKAFNGLMWCVTIGEKVTFLFTIEEFTRLANSWE